jgi:hypothetical protein
MIKFLKYLRSSFFQWLSTGLIILLIYSCGSFQYTPYRVENILAVTSEGDTIQMPISDLKRYYNFNTFADWQFYYGNNNWYYWSDWRLRYPTYNMWYYDWYRPYWYQIRPRVQPKTRNVPRYNVPQNRSTQPERSRVATPRGSRSNYVQPRQPQRSSTPSRVQTTPNVIQRNNVGRSSTGSRKIDN